MEHRIKWDKERNARREHGLIKGTQNRAEGFDLGLRTANMRMAIEEALALLNMAFIQPGFADVYIKQAMEALEKGRGEARVDIRDKTDISVISIIEEQTNYQGDQDA